MEFLLVFLVISLFSLVPVYAQQASQSDFITNMTAKSNKDMISNVTTSNFFGNMTSEGHKSDRDVGNESRHFSGNLSIGAKKSDFGSVDERRASYKALSSDFLENTKTEENRSFLVNQSSQSDFPGNMSASISDFLLDDNVDNLMAPDLTDLDCDTTNYPSTACEIALELMSLPANRIHGYPLSDQPDYVIIQTLNILNPENLTKVFQNMPPEELSTIRDKLTTQIFNGTLSRIPQPERQQIIDKIS